MDEEVNGYVQRETISGNVHAVLNVAPVKIYNYACVKLHRNHYSGVC